MRQLTDLICLGELLIDFVPCSQEGQELRSVEVFQKMPGGAPANVAVGFSRLGGKSGFIGKVGDDEFGKFLDQTLSSAGVDTRCLHFTESALTGLAFVSLRPDGERDFLFYRNPAADMLLEASEVDMELIQAAHILHFGSISLISSPAKEATLAAIQYAAENGKIVSFDPNLRPPLWRDLATARREILHALEFASMVKVSGEELAFIASDNRLMPAVELVFRDYPLLRLIAVTLGKAGCVICLRDRQFPVPGFRVEAVDATGAGDGFTAGLLFMIDEATAGSVMQTSCEQVWELQDEFWVSAGRFANAIGAIVVTGKGAIPSMPTYQTVTDFLRSAEKYPNLSVC